MKPAPRAIFIGTSAGGVMALQHLLAALPKGFSTPIAVTQHIPPTSSIDLPLVFGRHTALTLREARDKMNLDPGSVTFAPPAYHLLVETDGSLALTQEEPVHFARPSIDVLFESAADALGPRACGVLLTGANGDGARGLRAMHVAGGTTLVQDPATAEAPSMPREALTLFAPDYVGDLEGIAETLWRLTRGEAAL